MSSYLSNAIITGYSGILKNHHDTFARPILVYKNGNQTILSTTDPNAFNFAYPIEEQVNITYQPISGRFMARVYYPNKQETNFVSTNSISETAPSINFLNPKGLVRLKVERTGDGFIYLKDAKEAIIDGYTCVVYLDDRPHSLFEPQFATFYFQRNN